MLIVDQTIRQISPLDAFGQYQKVIFQNGTLLYIEIPSSETDLLYGKNGSNWTMLTPKIDIGQKCGKQ